MLTPSSEPNEVTAPAIHSKSYQRGMGLLIFLVTVAVLFGLIYLIPD